MIALRFAGLIAAVVTLTACLAGCARSTHDESQESRTSTTNQMPSISQEIVSDPEVRHYLETNSEARRFFQSLLPQIKRNQEVGTAIKKAVATNADVKVQAFREFLSHWHLQWPVVEEGAVGEGGIGFAWDKDAQKFRGGADAIAVIEDRYILRAILDCEVTKDYREVTFTKLRFSFEEVENVRLQSGGGCSVTFNTQTGRWLGPDDWTRLKESNWDFSAIGINLISNAPIPHIHEAFR